MLSIDEGEDKSEYVKLGVRVRFRVRVRCRVSLG